MILPSGLANLWGWYDASLVSGNDGDLISSLPDQSGHGYNLTASGTARPTLKLALAGGKNILRFNGSTSTMNTGAQTLAQPLTLFMVAIMQAHNNQGYLCDGIESGSNGCALEEIDANGTMQAVASASYSIQGNTTMPLGKLFIIEAVFSGTNSVLRYNNIELTGNTGTNAPSGFTVGSYKGGTTYLTQIDVCEAIIYSDAKSAANRTDIRNYLQMKWAPPEAAIRRNPRLFMGAPPLHFRTDFNSQGPRGKYFNNFAITGVTRDQYGSPLANCTCKLYRTCDDSVVQNFNGWGEQVVVSDAGGNFSFIVGNNAGPFYVVAYKAGSPDVAGTTINTLRAQ